MPADASRCAAAQADGAAGDRETLLELTLLFAAARYQRDVKAR